MSARAETAPLTVRPAADRDRPHLASLIDPAIRGSAYAEIPTYFLDAALQESRPDVRAIVAEREGRAVGVAVFGHVAGAVRTGRIVFVTVVPNARGHRIGIALCEAALAALAAEGARLVFAEVPDDPLLGGGQALLARCGFREEARVADYFRDGVALLVLRRTLRLRD